LAVLCVLHQPDLARRYADRILGLNRGRLVFEGQPARIDRREIASLYDAAA
jgi:phosphonate transport system ATP-binding protein